VVSLPLMSVEEIVNALAYWVRAGCAWRLLPHDLPQWQTVYHYWRICRFEGRWEQILPCLRERDRVGGGRDPHAQCGHHRQQHGMNMQIPADPMGWLVWASPALPGDVIAARTVCLVDALASAGMKTFTDKGYQGAGGAIRTPFKGHRHCP
jgi:transposase